MHDGSLGDDVIESRRWTADDDPQAQALSTALTTRTFRLAVVGLLVANAVATGAVWWELRSRHAEENRVRCIESVLTPQRETPLSGSQRELAELLDCDVPPALLQPAGSP